MTLSLKKILEDYGGWTDIETVGENHEGIVITTKFVTRKTMTYGS